MLIFVKTKFIKKGEMRAVLPANHHLSKKPYITLNDLSKEPFLLLEEGALSEPLEAFKQAWLEPSIRLCGHDDYSILSMIELGLGVSILPELVLRKTNYQVAIKYFIDFLFEHIEDLP